MLLDQIALYGARDAIEGMADEVVHHGKRAVLDWFSALLPGSSMAPSPQLMKAHSAELGLGGSSLLGSSTTAFAATAAWINGSASHAAEFDDIFRDAVYHPGCPVIAAALAVAEEYGRSGTELLRAVVVGYEISTRIGAAVQPAHYRYFHTTGTVGCLGAAAAASALMRPGDAAVMKHAIATSASFAAGLQQAFRSDAMTKALHAGHAASMGVRSAQAAAHGVTGAVDILEGPVGFGMALADSPDWSVALDGLGQEYNVMRVTQKIHGCCGHTFAALDAASVLQRQHSISVDDIETVRVRTYRTAIEVTGNEDPRSAFEARFSLSYVMAHMLMFGSVRLDAFTPERIFSPALRRLMARIHLHEDPALTAGFPRMRAARVEVILENGDSHALLAPHRRGDPEAPLDDTELNEKFDELVGPILGRKTTAALRTRIWCLDRLDDVRQLVLIHG